MAEMTRPPRGTSAPDDPVSPPKGAAGDVMQELRTAFKAVPVPVLLANPAGEIALTNAALDQLFGYQAGVLAGRPVEALVPDTVREYHPELRDAFLERPVSRPMGTGRDLYGMARDGRLIPVEIGLNPVEVAGGNWVLASVLDITERKKHEARVRLALDAAASAMIMVDDTGRMVLVNAQACEQFGFQEEELLGERVEMLVPARVRRRHGVYRNGYMRSPERRGMGVSRELFGLRKDGSEFPVEIGLTPMAVGEIAYTMATVIDVSDSRRHEAEIERRNEELRLLNEELNAFAYGASHDLKAPLSSISGLLAVAVRDLEAGRTEQVAAILTRAQTLAENLALKVEGVLGLAAADADGDSERSSFALADVIAEALLPLAPQMESLGITPRLELGHEDPVTLDRARLRAVLDNLLVNAVKFHDPERSERHVTIHTSDDGGWLTLEVEDNGLGIPAEQQHRVFNAFTRFGNHAQSGTGLGLSLVRKHVVQMRGSIEFSSSSTGTRFTVRLPRSEDSGNA